MSMNVYNITYTMKDADMPLLDRIEAALDRIQNRQGLMRIPREATDIDVVVLDCGDEIKRLRAEVAALKANDPLAEMWRELEAYQPMADRDGHGESWRRMCEERTEEAGLAAARAESAAWAWEAARKAAWAASWAAAAASWAAQSIDAIRRAKEAKS
jgi:hypothetical protein